MSRSSTLILLGILTILIPFSGLPIAVRTVLAVICGASVLGIGLAFRSREAQRVPSRGVMAASASAEVPRQEPPSGVSPI